MNAVGIQPADFVIAPDVTAFDISEFTRADEMARIGEATTDATIGNLRKMLNKLDPNLFAISSTNEGQPNSKRSEPRREEFLPSEPAA